MYILVS